MYVIVDWHMVGAEDPNDKNPLYYKDEALEFFGRITEEFKDYNNVIYEIMNELLAEGISIIMVSSELPELLGMCDRFMVMRGGKIVGELNKEEANQESIMNLCFA